MTAPRARKTDHHRQAAAIRERFPQLDAAIVAAQQALDDALLTGSDTRPYRSHVRTSIQARKKADSALQAVLDEQEAESRERVVAAARTIEKKASDARAKLLKKFEFSLEPRA